MSADNVYLNNAVFKQNHAKSGGGAVIALYSSNVSNCLFESNDIEIGSGGALYFVYASAVCHIVNSEFNSNTAYDGGGAVCANHELFVDNSTFFNNHAGVTGGAIKAGYLHINAYQPNTEPLNTFFRKNTVSDSRGSSNNGGAVYADFYVHAVNAVFSENQAKVDGGAIYAKGVVNVDHCLFESNVADGSVYESYGGAIHTTTDVDVNNCTFENNSAGDYGGAISAANAYVNNEQDAGQPYNSFFINNKAGDNDGGAIYVSNEKWSVYDSLFRVKNAVFKDNQAYEDGGAIFCDDKGEVAHCSFESNKANGAKYAQCEGGAIYCKNQLTVDNSIFDNNYAYDYGGAIYADNLAIRPYSYFDGNTAYDNHGGAIYTNKFTEDVKFVSFINNKAGEGSYDDGGAIYINGENHITFSQCVFAYNHCKGRGGAIFLDSSSSHLTLKNNIFSSNTADMDIQAVYNWGYYDAVNENFWAGINPSTSNTQLVEGKSVQSSIKHVDSNPLNLGLRLSKKTCKVNNQLWATADFSHNDGSQCFNKMFVGFITFVPTENISFSTRYDYDNSVIITLTPEKEGTYNITADLFGYNVSCELYVTFDSPFADLDDDTSPISDNNGNYDNYYGTGAVNEVLTSDLLSNQGENSTSVTNQSHSNSTAKSISQPDTAKSINSNTIILALVLVIALGAIVFWRKSKQ